MVGMPLTTVVQAFYTNFEVPRSRWSKYKSISKILDFKS